MLYKHIHAQSQKRKQQTLAQNMSKINNKDTSMTSLTLLWCLHHQLRTDPTLHPNAPFSDLEKTNVYWAIIISRESRPKVKPIELY